MFCAYQVEGVGPGEGSEWLEEGKRLESENLKQVRKSLETFVGANGEIDASKMMGEWFGGISADVFICHSRADKELALSLAGFLSQVFKLTVFVDSCAWGHANDLLRELDEAYCKIGETTYSYSQSTVTASHVHLMLGSALTQMMDRCECVFFLNTENSLKSISVQDMAKSNEENITQSPWLFHELSMLRLIRRRDKNEHRIGMAKKGGLVEKAASAPVFNYPVSLGDIPVLDTEELIRWVEDWIDGRKEEGNALDCLYEIKSPDGQKAIGGSSAVS